MKRKPGAATELGYPRKQNAAASGREANHDNRAPADQFVGRIASGAATRKSRETALRSRGKRRTRYLLSDDSKNLNGPGEFDEDRAGRREQNEIIPALAQGDGGDADIEDGDVAEERGRIIDPGRKQDGREKSAEQTEDHDDLRVHADSEEKRRGRHDRHGSERGDECDQMIENVGRKNIPVENQDAGRAEALAGDAVAPGRRQPAGHDEGEPDDRADHHPHGRSDQVVLEGILHEKNDPEEKNEAADPGEKLDPENASQSIGFAVAEAEAAAGLGGGGGNGGTGGGGGRWRRRRFGNDRRRRDRRRDCAGTVGLAAAEPTWTGRDRARAGGRRRDDSAVARFQGSHCAERGSRTVFFSLWISTTPTTIRTIGSNREPAEATETNG